MISFGTIFLTGVAVPCLADRTFAGIQPDHAFTDRVLEAKLVGLNSGVINKETVEPPTTDEVEAKWNDRTTKFMEQIKSLKQGYAATKATMNAVHPDRINADPRLDEETRQAITELFKKVNDNARDLQAYAEQFTTIGGVVKFQPKIEVESPRVRSKRPAPQTFRPNPRRAKRQRTFPSFSHYAAFGEYEVSVPRVYYGVRDKVSIPKPKDINRQSAKIIGQQLNDWTPLGYFDKKTGEVVDFGKRYDYESQQGVYVFELKNNKGEKMYSAPLSYDEFQNEYDHFDTWLSDARYADTHSVHGTSHEAWAGQFLQEVYLPSFPGRNYFWDTKKNWMLSPFSKWNPSADSEVMRKRAGRFLEIMQTMVGAFHTFDEADTKEFSETLSGRMLKGRDTYYSWNAINRLDMAEFLHGDAAQPYATQYVNTVQEKINAGDAVYM